MVAAPRSGFGRAGIDASVSEKPGGGPPKNEYASPVAFTVSTSDAMLNSARYGGDRACVRNVHWLHALVAATNIVSSAPSSSSAAKSTAYDTDIVDPLVVSGRLTLSAEAIDEQSRRPRKRLGLLMLCGAKTHQNDCAGDDRGDVHTRAAWEIFHQARPLTNGARVPSRLGDRLS